MKTLLAASLLVLGFLIAATPGAAQVREPMKSCGDLEAGNGLLIGDLLARRVTCGAAKQVARRLPGKCEGESPAARSRNQTRGW